VSASISAASLTTSAVWYSLSVSSTSLTASTTYWLVYSWDGAVDAANYVRGHQSIGINYPSTCKFLTTGSWASQTEEMIFGVPIGSGSTIDGGTATNPDATDGWGVVGFALIGTTVAATPVSPPFRAQVRPTVYQL
jgi:hypothetical protein